MEYQKPGDGSSEAVAARFNSSCSLQDLKGRNWRGETVGLYFDDADRHRYLVFLTEVTFHHTGVCEISCLSLLSHYFKQQVCSSDWLGLSSCLWSLLVET